MNISLNGEPRHLPDGSPLQAIVEEAEKTSVPYSIAVNGTFVPRGRYAEVRLADGDRVDIVTPMQGG